MASGRLLPIRPSSTEIDARVGRERETSNNACTPLPLAKSRERAVRLTFEPVGYPFPVLVPISAVRHLSQDRAAGRGGDASVLSPSKRREADLAEMFRKKDPKGEKGAHLHSSNEEAESLDT